MISYFLFLLYSRDHPLFFGRIVSPPGVDDDVDDVDRDTATDVQTNFVSSQYSFTIATKSKTKHCIVAAAAVAIDVAAAAALLSVQPYLYLLIRTVLFFRLDASTCSVHHGSFD